MLVSCIMVTRGRPQWVGRALDCWREQTYPDRELVIVDDRDRPSFPRGISESGIVYHEMTRRLTIGAKRNVACSRSGGDVICHWDDDDWSAPQRIADQLARLLESGKAVTGYSSMEFVCGQERWLYEGMPDYSLGTSLMYRREWWEAHPFSELERGEDNEMWARAREAKQYVAAPSGGLMVATEHPGNTSPRDFSGTFFTRVA